ncbi:MAG TPA: peptidylprolyl isomerase [Chitinophagaceae bacterium]|jgi:peptidyl-prolyl cis-trans isomerase B (cyclophilin B)|nr:peptidylprolyl isomerase [Chitinophagaceae bacterium]
MKASVLATLFLLLSLTALAQDSVRLRRRDRKRDVELVTTAGTLRLRLYAETPEHRDNFLRLVKSGYYDSVLFHRVIRHFMIQAGDPNSRSAAARQPLGNGGPGYTVPAEFRPQFFHKKGALAAARTGDNVNPEKRSSGSQFYIVQGRTFTDFSLDSVQTHRLQGRRLPDAHRAVYKTLGGAPHLDGNYTVFGEVVQGLEVVDRIAATATASATSADRDRPLQDMRILRARLVKRRR